MSVAGFFFLAGKCQSHMSGAAIRRGGKMSRAGNCQKWVNVRAGKCRGGKMSGDESALWSALILHGSLFLSRVSPHTLYTGPHTLLFCDG